MELELLTPAEFDAHLENGTLRLAFVGMSNAGKSYRSKVLARERDFLWYQVDEEIQKALGFATMEEISSWLGLPSRAGYKEREKEYLALEERFTKQASMEAGGKNFVFDTTGSVAHLSPETLHILKENCLVVHLEVSADSIHKMVEKYFAEPKPVAWCEYFEKEDGEADEAALHRSYPALLRERLKKYYKIAHLNIPTASLRDKSAEETLTIIKKHLA